jgi:hypothetical protein
MRESRPYGSVRGARGETRVPTATPLPNEASRTPPYGALRARVQGACWTTVQRFLNRTASAAPSAALGV